MCFFDRISAPGNNTSFEDKVNGNPIGLLQEMCMSRRWPPPTYETGKYFLSENLETYILGVKRPKGRSLQF